MLIVTRSKGQVVRIGHEVSVTVVAVRGGQVHLGFRTPPALPVNREEVYLRKYGQGGTPPTDPPLKGAER